MTNVRLIDSCAHPTCNGQWIGGRRGVTHDQLARDLSAHGYAGALAIGLPGVGYYTHGAFLDLCRVHPALIPVAALTECGTTGRVVRDLDEIVALGYRIVKVHPRLLGYEQTLRSLPAILGACVERDLAVALCTYPEYRSPIDPDDARRMMADAMLAHPAGRFLALHAGVLEPAPFAAAAFGNPSVLLDFSLSLLKYPDQVFDSVVQLLARQPGGQCLGSDGPEWTYAQVADSLSKVGSSAGQAAAAALGGGNLSRWLIEAGIHVT